MTHRPLPTLSSAELDQLFARESRPVLVEFAATWCGPCKMIEPVLAAIAAERVDQLVVVKVDLDASPDLAVRFGVRGAPTMILARGGVEAGRRLGATSKSTLLTWLAEAGALSSAA